MSTIFSYFFFAKRLIIYKKYVTIFFAEIYYILRKKSDMQENNIHQEAENEQPISPLPEKITKEDLIQNENTTQSKVLYYVKTVLMLLFSSFIVSFAAHCLIEPNEFTIGGAAGIAIMISYATKGQIPQSLVSFFINFPLIILSFFFVKRKFALLTAANILLQVFWLFLLETFNAPLIIFPESSRIFSALAGGVCIGVAVALAFKVGGSTGGTDIIAVMMQKKVQSSSIAWLLFFINAIVIGASFFVINTEAVDLATRLLPIMLSVFEVYIESKTNEFITNGFHSAREFRIITDKPEQMAHALMKELSRGVTAIPATGMYTKITHTMLLCVVSRRQVATLKRIMKKVDPDSFAVMSNVSQVLGLGFYTGE